MISSPSTPHPVTPSCLLVEQLAGHSMDFSFPPVLCGAGATFGSTGSYCHSGMCQAAMELHARLGPLLAATGAQGGLPWGYCVKGDGYHGDERLQLVGSVGERHSHSVEACPGWHLAMGVLNLLALEL